MCFCFRKKKQDSLALNSRIATSATSPPQSASVLLDLIPAPAAVSATPALASRPSSTSSAAALPPTLWEKAIQRLNDEDRELIVLKPTLQDPTELDILRVFVRETEKQKDECERRQWRYTDSAGEEVRVRDYVNTLLANLNKYTFIGDLVIQPLPAVVSLAWGGFKALLQVAIADMENRAVAMESLDSLARILSHCGIYERLYGQQARGAAQPLDASESLNTALLELYVLVLEYLCYLKRHLGQNTAVQSFKNIASGVKLRWEALLAMESAVDKEACVAQQEAMEKHMFVNNARIEEMLVLLKETSTLREPILEIQRTVEGAKAEIEETKHTVQNIFKSIQEVERRSILNWISDVSHTQHHEFNKSMRSPGTGGWLLEKPNFRSWDESENSSLFWLHGIAGSGKTTLTCVFALGAFNSTVCGDAAQSMFFWPLCSALPKSFYPPFSMAGIARLGANLNRSKIIDDMEPKTTDYSLAYFYCNYKEAQRRDPASIVRSLVKQLCLRTPGVGSSPSFPRAVLALYTIRSQNSDLGRTLSINECKDLLIELSTGFLRTTIIVDALDECDQETRGQLCDLLADVVSASKRIKVFITSRDEGDLRVKFEDSPDVYIQERDNSVDINRYINVEIKACIDKKKLLGGKVSVDLQMEVINALQLGAHGMFIWVKHLITMICDEVTEDGVQAALKELPKDLNDLYLQILRAIRTQKSSRVATMANRAFAFILCAERPLDSDELLAAAAYPSSILTPQVLLDICRGFVVNDTERYNFFKGWSKYFEFAHFSVQEFLMNNDNLEEAHATVAEICLRVLLDADDESVPSAMLDYATLRWQTHVRQSGTRNNALCIQFLAPCPGYVAWVSRASNRNDEFRPHESQTLPPLLVACIYELVDIIEFLLSEGANPELTNGLGMTSLHCAAATGNQTIIRLLLTREVKCVQDRLGRTPLSLAAKGGHQEVVRMLLQKYRVCVDSRDEDGRTALSVAAAGGHEKVVQLLIETGGVNVNVQDQFGQTPLSYAAGYRRERVVHMLLQNDSVDVNSRDRRGQTAVHYAVHGGDEKSLRMLLEKDGVDVDSKDDEGRTPLFFAAAHGTVKLVQPFLERVGVDVNSKNQHGSTPLQQAMVRGCEEVVKMLLEDDRVDVNSRDNQGQTALHDAVICQEEKLVYMMLDKEGVDVDSQDIHGRTPLFYAVESQLKQVENRLLAKGALDIVRP